MKFKLDRIISIATLVASLVAIVLVLKKPAPVAHPQAPSAIAEHAQSSDQKTAPAESATEEQRWRTSSETPESSAGPASSPAAASPKADAAHDEVSAAVAQMLGSAGGAAGLSPSSNAGSGSPNIKDQQVTYEGDIVHGRFLTEIAGKDVWVTISGKMGQKDGYATFDPTEFKVGDMNVPVSLVNPALQKKMAEERDRLKISDGGGEQQK